MAEETSTEETPAMPAGVPEGTVIETPVGEPNEVIVHDLDADGNVIGWHKEQVNG